MVRKLFRLKPLRGGGWRKGEETWKKAGQTAKTCGIGSQRRIEKGGGRLVGVAASEWNRGGGVVLAKERARGGRRLSSEESGKQSSMQGFRKERLSAGSQETVLFKSAKEERGLGSCRKGRMRKKESLKQPNG